MRNSGVGFARFFMIEVARILGVGCVPNFLGTLHQRSEARDQSPYPFRPELPRNAFRNFNNPHSSIPIPHLAKLPLTQRHQDTKGIKNLRHRQIVTQSPSHPVTLSPCHLVPLSDCPLITPSQPIQRTHNPKRLLRHMRINLRCLHRLMPQ